MLADNPVSFRRLNPKLSSIKCLYWCLRHGRRLAPLNCPRIGPQRLYFFGSFSLSFSLPFSVSFFFSLLSGAGAGGSVVLYGLTAHRHPQWRHTDDSMGFGVFVAQPLLVHRQPMVYIVIAGWLLQLLVPAKEVEVVGRGGM